jgi:hypothetical protein
MIGFPFRRQTGFADLKISVRIGRQADGPDAHRDQQEAIEEIPDGCVPPLAVGYVP